MQKDRLEEKLRTSLSEYPSPLDLEGAWSKLERTRNKEKKRRGVWFWWLGGAVAILGIFLITLSDSVEQEIDFTSNKLEKKELTPLIQVEEPTNITSRQSLVEVETGKNLPIDNRAKEKVLNLVSESDKQTKKPSPSSLPNSKSNTFNNRGMSTKLSDIKTPSVADPSKEDARVLPSTIRQSLSALPSRAISPLKEAASVSLKGLPLEEVRFRRKNQGAGSWWIGFSGTLGSQQRRLEVNSSDNSDIESWLNRREAAEQELEAYSFSFDIRKDFGSNWYFQTGLRHQLAFDRFVDQYERTFDKVLEDQLTEIIQRADGTTTEIRGDVTVEVTESLSSTIYNTQNVTELPLLVGYRQDLTGDFGLDLNLGVLYGFVQRTEGMVFSDSNASGAYQSLGQLPYRPSNLWGAQLQAGITYQLGEKWRCLGGFQTKYYPNTVQSNADFREGRLLFNATIGMQFILGQ